MRIALANAYLGQVGGAEVYLSRALGGLAGRGHRLALLVEDDASGRAPVVPAAIEVATWSVARLGAGGALAALAGWRPDLVFVQGLRSPEVEAALVAAHPAALFAHGYYGTCATGSKCHAFPRPRPCRRTFGPACLALHYPRRCGGLSPVASWAGYRLQAARRALLPRYRAVVVASEALRAEMVRHGVAPERVHRIAPPAAAGAHAHSDPVLAREGGAPPSRLLFVGRLTALKGPRLLLSAVALAERRLGRRLPLTVAGSGPEEPRLRRLARRLGLAVEFAGWVGEADLRERMRAADLLAVPSVWPEPFGLVGIEAAAAGLPAVAFATGGIPDWLTPGVTGEAAPADPPTAAGLAAAIYRALADPAHHRALRGGALAGAARFALAPHLDALEEIFADL